MGKDTFNGGSGNDIIERRIWCNTVQLSIFSLLSVSSAPLRFVKKVDFDKEF
ncbi:hypothetical protein IQ229_05170 [Nostoc cf. edaphicum LEGE 07299]|uniref:Uncharacterized protein n=1 Tax=Nostoc cf. edaphicum LEGE 07299 TaxID=2777974 RepID=A0ABR9TVB7_9NOSO|nr:hypothetical protein [Nostoc cf. edaphicum LEGE 07299]